MFYTVFQLCSPKWHLLKQLTCWLVGRSVIRSWHVFGDVCMTWCYLLRNQLQWVAAALSFWNQFLFWWVCCHYDYPERSMLICSMPSKFKRQNKRHITRNVLTFPIYVKKEGKLALDLQYLCSTQPLSDSLRENLAENLLQYSENAYLCHVEQLCHLLLFLSCYFRLCWTNCSQHQLTMSMTVYSMSLSLAVTLLWHRLHLDLAYRPNLTAWFVHPSYIIRSCDCKFRYDYDVYCYFLQLPTTVMYALSMFGCC